MSHFTCMVIGDNPEEQLRPYHEYECTGVMDQYVEFIPKEESDEELEEDFSKYKDDYNSFEEFLQMEYGYEKVNGEWGRYTNPNCKWDWYRLGGRWNGFLLLKDGANANRALKKDIDFKGMMEQSRKKAKNDYCIIKNACGGEIPKIETSWFEAIKIYESFEKARDFYYNQESIKTFKNAIKKLGKSYYFNTLEEFQCTEEVYGQMAADRAVSTFAVVKDGKWYEKGDKGWFGVSINEMDQMEWDKKIAWLLSEIPDDTLISIYDCHI